MGSNDSSDSIPGSRLRQLREDRGLSRERLASEAGISTATLYRAEAGKHRPGVDTLRRIAEGLGLTLPELLGTVPLPTAPSTGLEAFRRWAESSPVVAAQPAWILREVCAISPREQPLAESDYKELYYLFVAKYGR